MMYLRACRGWVTAAIVVAALVFVPFTPRAAESEVYDAQTKADIQSVITRQLAAFDRGDAKAAEEFATPAIKDKFAEPSKFLAMVKENYAALIHPKSTQFNERRAIRRTVRYRR